MWNDRDRQVRRAESLLLRAAEPDEAARADGDRGFAALRELDTIVDTPRCAGASVAGPGDDRVRLLDEFAHHRLGRTFGSEILPFALRFRN